MEQITILVRDRHKAKSLLDLLRALDFVAVLEIEDVEDSSTDTNNGVTREEEFFAAAGIWKDRDVTVDSLRAEAWPRRNP
jgi:hypothetical protein